MHSSIGWRLHPSIAEVPSSRIHSLVERASPLAMAVGPESSALPQPLEGFLASQRSLDALLSTGHYRGSGAVARQLRAAAAAWVAGGQQGPAPLGAFAAALFAKVRSW